MKSAYRIVFRLWQVDNRKKEEQQAHLRRIMSMMITVITVHCCLNLPWLITVNLPIKDEEIYFYIITPAVVISELPFRFPSNATCR